MLLKFLNFVFNVSILQKEIAMYIVYFWYIYIHGNTLVDFSISEISKSTSKLLEETILKFGQGILAKSLFPFPLPT